MARRSNPWPALVDLFGAFLIVGLGGMVLLASSYQVFTASAVEKMEDIERANDRSRMLDDSLGPIVISTGSGKVRFSKRDGDLVIDLQLTFERERHEVTPEDYEKLRGLSTLLKSRLADAVKKPELKGRLRLVVEGHADRTLSRTITDPKQEFRINWDLSAQRAVSTLYSLCELGLVECTRGEVASTGGGEGLFRSVQAIGYGSTQPLCLDETQACYRQNRRTTLRIQIDNSELSAEKTTAIPVR